MLWKITRNEFDSSRRSTIMGLLLAPVAVIFFPRNAHAETLIPLAYGASTNGWIDILSIGAQPASFSIKVRGVKDPKTGKLLTGNYKIQWSQRGNRDTGSEVFARGGATTKKLKAPQFTTNFSTMAVSVIIP